ncbi:MAG: hypothetical protein HC912_02610 [Saprospiraceae bacterium]|nr:hypothetical protein [Saprospiraceae bacterium]
MKKEQFLKRNYDEYKNYTIHCFVSFVFFHLWFAQTIEELTAQKEAKSTELATLEAQLKELTAK